MLEKPFPLGGSVTNMTVSSWCSCCGLCRSRWVHYKVCLTDDSDGVVIEFPQDWRCLTCILGNIKILSTEGIEVVPQ